MFFKKTKSAGYDCSQCNAVENKGTINPVEDNDINSTFTFIDIANEVSNKLDEDECFTLAYTNIDWRNLWIMIHYCVDNETLCLEWVNPIEHEIWNVKVKTYDRFIDFLWTLLVDEDKDNNIE